MCVCVCVCVSMQVRFDSGSEVKARQLLMQWLATTNNNDRTASAANKQPAAAAAAALGGRAAANVKTEPTSQGASQGAGRGATQPAKTSPPGSQRPLPIPMFTSKGGAANAAAKSAAAPAVSASLAAGKHIDTHTHTRTHRTATQLLPSTAHLAHNEFGRAECRFCPNVWLTTCVCVCVCVAAPAAQHPGMAKVFPELLLEFSKVIHDAVVDSKRPGGPPQPPPLQLLQRAMTNLTPSVASASQAFQQELRTAQANGSIETLMRQLVMAVMRVPAGGGGSSGGVTTQQQTQQAMIQPSLDGPLPAGATRQGTCDTHTHTHTRTCLVQC